MTLSAPIILELAGRADGYLAKNDEVINVLRREGLIMIQDVGDGFVIAKTIHRPQRRLRNRQWYWPQADEARAT